MKKEYIKPASKAHYVAAPLCITTSERAAEPEQGMEVKESRWTDDDW